MKTLTRDEIVDGAMTMSDIYGWPSCRVITWMAWHTFKRQILTDRATWVMLAALSWLWCAHRVILAA